MREDTYVVSLPGQLGDLHMINVTLRGAFALSASRLG
jgi:hypothetical protein